MEKFCSHCYVFKKNNISSAEFLPNYIDERKSFDHISNTCATYLNSTSIDKTMHTGTNIMLGLNCKDDVQKICNDRINCIEKRIQLLRSEGKSILDSSNKLKNEIKNRIDEEICILKKRETVLCSQVDALYNHQNSLVEEQQFKMHTTLGSYNAILESLPHRNDFENIKQEIKTTSSYLDGMSCFSTQKFEFLDNKDLKPLIQSYGKLVNMNGQNEIFVLSESEDLDEKEYMFVSKTALKDQILEKDNHDTEMKSLKALYDSSKIDNSFSFDNTSPELLLKQALNDQFAKNDVIFSTPSSSIAVPCSTDSFDVIMAEKEDNIKDKETGMMCNCNQPADMDIESLGDLSCTMSHNSQKSDDVAKWLKRNDIIRPPSHTEVNWSVPPIDALCKKDKICSSYSACVNPDNCLVSHLKEQLERIRLSSDVFHKTQLNNTINQVIQNETHKGGNDNKMTEKPILSSEPDLSGWLRSQKIAHLLSDDIESWLSDSSIASNQDAKNLVDRLFSSYFVEDNNIGKWLHKSLGRNAMRC